MKISERERARIEEQKAEEKAKSLRHMSDPRQWFGLVCPVKRRAEGSGMPELAYLIGDGPNLYHGNMLTRSVEDRKEEFKDFHAIIDAGWVVD